MNQGVSRFSTSPLAKAYFEAMLQKGHTEGTADFYARQVQKIDIFMAAQEIPEYNRDVGEAFYEAWLQQGTHSESLKSRLTVIIQRLNQMMDGVEISFCKPRKEAVELPDAIKDGIDAYWRYSTSQRGLKPDTLKYHVHALEQFFALSGITEFSEITVQHIEHCFSGMGNKRAYKTAIKHFLSFLYQKGSIPSDLSELVPIVLPRIPNSYPLPSVYTEEEISRILQSIDRSSVKGCRDYAMLLLACRLGLRPSDICGLTLRAVDFRSGTVRFMQKKTSIYMSLPLLPDVESALLAYLEFRPGVKPEDAIFVRSVAPHHPLSRIGIWDAMRKYLKVSEVEAGRRGRGVRAFRSSLASSMVEGGVPYYAVQKVLGHESPQSARNYIRIDTEGLRRHTLPVPEASRAFALFLEGGASVEDI